MPLLPDALSFDLFQHSLSKNVPRLKILCAVDNLIVCKNNLIKTLEQAFSAGVGYI
jgi:hypothetical protein